MRTGSPEMAVLRTTPQLKRKPKPSALEKSYRKIPMADRINMATKPNDPDFIKMEQYFDRQLRNDNQNIQEILEEHFTPLEIELFIPEERGRFANMQREDTNLYQALLAGPFRGKKPTLACKMAMLFFGLPVAPMKMKLFQMPSAFDVATYGDKEQASNYDHLAFLDEYSESSPASAAGSKQDTGPVPNLRGGGLDNEAMEIVLSGYQSAISPRGGTPSNDDLTDHISATSKKISIPLINIYGCQGSIGIGPDWADFIEGVVFLLGLRKEQQSRQTSDVFIAIDVFENSGLRHLKTYEGLLSLNPANYGQQCEDKIHGHITDNISFEQYKNGRRCFVRFARDRRPPSAVPTDSEKGYIKVCRFDIPERPIVYMRTTMPPSKYNCASQYSLEFNRAISHLLPSNKQHHYLHLSLESGSNHVQHFGRIHAGQDLPQGLIDIIPQAVANGNSCCNLQINVQMETFGYDNIPIFTSMCRDNLEGDELGIIGVISKSELPRMNDIADLIVDYCVRADESRNMVQCVELYLPAQSFFDESIEPVLCYYEYGQAVATEDLWFERIKRFSKEDNDIFNEGFAIWGRPVFHKYTLVNNFDVKGTPENVIRNHTVKNLLDLDLASFKFTVSTFLFPQRYDLYDQNHVLFLSTGDEHDRPEYVVRFDTTEYEWFRIKRRIASDKIQVKIAPEEEKYDLENGTRWYIDSSSYWGPSHDNPSDNLRLVTIDKEVQKPKAVTMTDPNHMTGKKAIISSAKQSRYFTKTKDFIGNMRDQVKWKAPSVFANPIKPVIPLNGPSIETFLQLGPRIPMVTMGMRTPTEVAQLEGEVQKLRYFLLNRTRECPYSDCENTFEYHDQESLDTHLKEDHPVLRCPYCVATGMQGNETENELYFQNADQAMHHFNQYHWKHMMSQANIGVNSQGLVSSGIPSVVLSNEGRQEIVATYKHCTRCGRDQTTCHRREDRENHEKKCPNMGVNRSSMETAQILRNPGYCVYCGVETHGHCPNPKCVAKNSTIHDPPEICCINCGIAWDGFDNSYQASHKAGCMPLGGEAWDFCGFCGSSFVGMDHARKLSHVEFCNDRPRPQSVRCPMCLAKGTEKELRSPEQVKSHLENYHKLPTNCLWCDQSFPAHDPVWAECVKIQHFATHMGAVPQISGINPGAKVSEGHEKCPGFMNCGVIIGQMTSDQFRLHWAHSHDNEPRGQIPYCPNGQIMQRPEGKYNDVKDWHPISASQIVKQDRQTVQDWPVREYQYEWTFPKTAIQRPQSPKWEELAKYSPGEGFIPSENMRCSRCFKPAPSGYDTNYEYEVSLHSDPKYACHIRRAPSEWQDDNVAFPNRSGWVIFPKGFDFIAARRSFLDQYPAYQGTVFPFDDDRAEAVYNGEQPNLGVQSDDVLSDKAPWRHALPWPPIAGWGEYRNLSEKNPKPIQVPAQKEASAASTKRITMRTGITAHRPATSHMTGGEISIESEPNSYSSIMDVDGNDARNDVRVDDLTEDSSRFGSEEQTRSTGQAPVQGNLDGVPNEETNNRSDTKAALSLKGKKRLSVDLEALEQLDLSTTLPKRRSRRQTKKDYAADISDGEVQPPKRFRRAPLGFKSTGPAYGVGESNGTQNSDPTEN